jgi:hypothetical protein
VEKLVVVEEAFADGPRGVTVAPRITVNREYPSSFSVRLRPPGAPEREAKGSLQVAHIRGPNGAFAIVRISGLAVADVPPGTEIWADF